MYSGCLSMIKLPRAVNLSKLWLSSMCESPMMRTCTIFHFCTSPYTLTDFSLFISAMTFARELALFGVWFAHREETISCDANRQFRFSRAEIILLNFFKLPIPSWNVISISTKYASLLKELLVTFSSDFSKASVWPTAFRKSYSNTFSSFFLEYRLSSIHTSSYLQRCPYPIVLKFLVSK